MNFLKNSLGLGLMLLLAAAGQMEASIPGFVGKKYLEFNPDVAKAGVDPVVHFTTYGYKENRKIQINDPEGKSHIGNFSLADYLKKNPDLAPGLGITKADVPTQLQALFNHYQQYGYKENRNILTNATIIPTPEGDVLGLGGAFCDPTKNGSDCASGYCNETLMFGFGPGIETRQECLFPQMHPFIPQPIPVIENGKIVGMKMTVDPCTIPVPRKGHCSCLNDSQCHSDRQCVTGNASFVVRGNGEKVKFCEDVCFMSGVGVNKRYGCDCKNNSECSTGLICNSGKCDVASPSTSLETLQRLQDVMREIKEDAQAFAKAPQDQRIGKLIELQAMQGNNVGLQRLGAHIDTIAKVVPVQLQALLPDEKFRSGLVDLLNNLKKAVDALALKPADIKIMQANPASTTLDNVRKAIDAFTKLADQAAQMEALFAKVVQKNTPQKSPAECLNLLV